MQHSLSVCGEPEGFHHHFPFKLLHPKAVYMTLLGWVKSCHIRQTSPSWSLCLWPLSCAYMTKIKNAAQNRSFRRWVRQVFTGFIKRQDRNYLEEIFEKLQDLKESIDIMAREIARQAKRGR